MDREPNQLDVTHHRVRFEGKAGEFFGIWIVNIILSVLTLGIYSAWAKVRTTRYFYGNTYVDDSAFEYTAQPLQILKGRLLAVALLIAIQAASFLSPTVSNFALLGIMLAFPALMVMAMRFRMYHTRWRGIRFGFEPDIRQAYVLFLPLVVFVALLGLVAMGMPTEPTPAEELGPEVMWLVWTQLGLMLAMAVLFPWWHNRYYGYMGNRTRFGKQPFFYTGGCGRLYKLYFVAGAILFGGFVVLGFLAALLSHVSQYLLVLAFLAGAAIYASAIAYLLTARTNLVYSRLTVGEATLHSELRFQRMWVLYVTNTLAIVLSLGLAIPWAKIRMARYRADTFSISAPSLDDFVGAPDDAEQAVAEEMSDVFAWDFGL